MSPFCGFDLVRVPRERGYDPDVVVRVPLTICMFDGLVFGQKVWPLWVVIVVFVWFVVRAADVCPVVFPDNGPTSWCRNGFVELQCELFGIT